jgi:hypothetical protein
MSDDPKATLPTSTTEYNKKLDAQIIRKEPFDETAPWYERWRDQFFATAYSTVRAWFQ